MKVVCIDNDNDWFYLTIGKVYEVIIVSDFGYILINDISIKCNYRKEYFKTLSEIRNEKIDKLLD
jgi:hypothetical protein